MEILTTAILIIAGLFVALLANIAIKQIAKFTIYKWSKKLSPSIHKRVVMIVSMIALVVGIVIILFFLAEALVTLELVTMSKLLEATSAQLSTFIIAGIIFALGIIIAKITALKVEALDIPSRKTVAFLVEIVILAATVLTALENLGLKVTAFMELFRAGVWGFAITIAIIFGVSLGITLKPKIAKLLKSVK